jgi:hypothetical protein
MRSGRQGWPRETLKAAAKHGPRMAAPRRAALWMLLPLLAASVGGCTVVQDLQGFLDRASGVPQFAEATLLDEEVAFQPTDTTGTPPSPGRTARVNFTVPSGARDLRVEVTVAFDPLTPPPPVPLPPLPAEPPAGQVNVTVRPPSGETRSFAFTANGVQVFSAATAASGAWGVDVVAVGGGSVRLFAAATVPRA